MVDRYYRKIEDVENDIENAMQISGILLKLKGYDKKLEGLSKIGDNENNISSNSGKIDGNINTIKLVNKNSQDNRSDISTNTESISTNSEQISTNTESISTNSEQISTNTEFVSNNLENIIDIDKIKLNLNNIKNELSDFKINYSIQNLFIYNIDVEKNYISNKNNPKFSIFSYNLEDNFKSNSILEVNCKILYNYTTYNNIGTLMHVFKLYDKNNELIHEYKNLKSSAGDNLSAFLNQNDLFYVKLNDNYSIIKIELILSILDNITKSVSCKLLNTFKSNFLYIKHYKKINTLSVNNNLTDLENDISSNLGKIKTNLININTNEDNIAYNLNEINYLKNNKSTQYLKNIYNILFYNSKEQISFKDEIFYEKMFNINGNINDFIEMSFKIELEYQDIDDRRYVKSIYEIFDENNNRLYIKSISNDEYLYFSNKLTIDENIFYTFTKNIKKIKFIIKFQKLSTSRVIYTISKMIIID